MLQQSREATHEQTNQELGSGLRFTFKDNEFKSNVDSASVPPRHQMKTEPQITYNGA